MTLDKDKVLLARQPIYNRNKEIVAYELLFRSDTDEPITSFDGNLATSRVLLNLFTQSDIATVTNNLPAFVNFTEELLLNPPLFDAQTIVIEILEDIKVTNELIDCITNLKNQGYQLALDDFVMDEAYRPLLPLVDIIKLELPEMLDDKLEATIKELRQYNAKLLAEKIETPEQFNRCHELGCDLFQGYFMSKPEIVTGKKISANGLVILKLIAEIQAPEADIDELSRIISQDPGLSFKLLKLINSAAFKRKNTIESIQKAVTLLGIDKIKSWASLLALSKLDDKPDALHFNALTRALMCERLAEYIDIGARDRFYTVGLLSSLDAFFDQPLALIVEKLGLDEVLEQSLLHFSGSAGLALSTTLNFEKAHWHNIDWNALSQYELNAKMINTMYYESSTLALSLTSES